MSRSTFLFVLGFLFALIAPSGGEVARADDAARIRADLQKLYPYFSASVLDAKIQAAKTPFEFLRSFIPYYYETFGKSSLPKPVEQLRTEAGWCVGDAHFENFGAVLNAKSKARFTITDLGDAGPCPLGADALRFLTGALMNDPKADLHPLINGYLNGLGESDANFTSTVKDIIKKSERKGPNPKDRDLAASDRLARDEGAHEVPTAEKNQVATALASTYGKSTELLDVFSMRKVGGGSHWLLRYRALVQLKDYGLQVIELKQMVDPAVFPVKTGPIPGPADRVARSLSLEQGDHPTPL